MWRLISVFLVLSCIVSIFLPSLALSTPTDNISQSLLHAETYYWLGLAENDGMQSLEK